MSDEPIEVNAEEDLPVATWSGTQELFGFKLTVHVLDNGMRVYEDNDELRRMLDWLQSSDELTSKPPQEGAQEE